MDEPPYDLYLTAHTSHSESTSGTFHRANLHDLVLINVQFVTFCIVLVIIVISAHHKDESLISYYAFMLIRYFRQSLWLNCTPFELVLTKLIQLYLVKLIGIFLKLADKLIFTARCKCIMNL